MNSRQFDEATQTYQGMVGPYRVNEVERGEGDGLIGGECNECRGAMYSGAFGTLWKSAGGNSKKNSAKV